MFLRLFKYLWPERYLPEPEQDDPFNEDPPPRAPGKVGVLLVNLGTPDAPTARDIRKYLGEFLSDPRVIEIPRYLWKPILHGLVLTLRPKKLAPRYAGIWLQDGSPLMVTAAARPRGVPRALREAGVDATVELGMRYGNPSIPDAIGRLRALRAHPDGAALSAVRRQHHRHGGGRRDPSRGRLRDQPELRFIKRFHEDAFYLDALAGRIESYWREHGRPQKLVMSFHGLPRYSIELGDPTTAIAWKRRGCCRSVCRCRASRSKSPSRAASARPAGWSPIPSPRSRCWPPPA